MEGLPDVPAAVAAGHEITAQAGADVLAAGGSAADAAVAAMLTACAAESLLTGLGGGGFATYWDAAKGSATVVDFFVTVPGNGPVRQVSEPVELDIVFGPQRLEYLAGPATVAVPGVPAGVAEVHRRWGRLPWADVVTPAYEAARAGSPFSAAHEAMLADCHPAMLLGADGRAAYAPSGRLLRAGDPLIHEGLDDAFALLRDEGPAPFYSGDVGRAVVALMAEQGGLVSAEDLAAYEVVAGPARRTGFAGYDVWSRTDLLDVPGTLARLPDGVGSLGAVRRLGAWVAALAPAEDVRGDTTNVSVVDRAGNACVMTTSLGLGSGSWVPGFGIHLNSMLGEGELMRGRRPPGARVDSMMCPLVASRGGRLALAAGAAGGSRIRSSLVQVVTGVLAEGVDVETAVGRPRINPVTVGTGTRVLHAEPGTDHGALTGFRDRGWHVERWDRRAAYFGGVSAVGVSGAAADPRRTGVAVVLDGPAAGLRRA